MLTFDSLCLELFVLAQQGIDDVAGASGKARGSVWEELVADHLAHRGVHVESVPGGYRVLGFSSVSGLMHQVDATLACTNAIVIAEWKAYRGTLPKNELLRFKASTDDYFMSFGSSGLTQPVFRVFGGIGSASDSLRRYAAVHGIALIEQERWPLSVLISEEVVWPGALTAAPSFSDRKALAWGVRPMQHVMCPQASGGFLFPRPESAARVTSFLRLHDHWSDRLWEVVDLHCDGPEAMVADVRRSRRAG